MPIPEKIYQAICHLELFSEQFVSQVMDLTEQINQQLPLPNPGHPEMSCLWSELLDTLKQYEETVTEAVAETVHVHLPKALSAACAANANKVTHTLLKAKQCLDDADNDSLDLTSDLMELMEQPNQQQFCPTLLHIEDFTTEALYDLGLSLDDIVNQVHYK